MTTVASDQLSHYLSGPAGKVDFVLDMCTLPDGRRLADCLDRDPWIVRDVLAPIFAVDATGLPLHPLCYIELPRGHWKTGGIAGVAITEALLHPSTEVIAAAVDVDQAGLILDSIHGYLARNPYLRRSFKVNKGVIDVPANGSRIRVLSSDLASAFGVGGTHSRMRYIFDELSHWPRRDLFDSLYSATGKMPDTQTVVLSNAGFDPGQAWQYSIRGDADYLYSPDGIVASWVTPTWVERMRKTLPPPVFERLILNRWVSESGDFVSAEQLAACFWDSWEGHQVGEPGCVYYGGLDLGLTKDRTALCVVHRQGDERVFLDYLRVWQGSRGAPVDIATIDAELLLLGRRYPGVQLFADPWQLQSTIGRLRGKLRIKAYPFTSTSVARLSESLFEAITGERLILFPDKELQAEKLALRTVQTSSGWKVDHQKQGFSDRAIALGLAIMGAAAGRSGTVPEPVVHDLLNMRLPVPEHQKQSLDALYGPGGIPDYAIDPR